MLELADLSSSNADSIELSYKEAEKIAGGTIGGGATLAAFNSISETPFPSPGKFLTDTAKGTILPIAGIAATVVSGGTVPLLVAGVSLKD